MANPLLYAMLVLHPDAVQGRDFDIKVDADGGLHLINWNPALGSEPTQAEIDAAQAAGLAAWQRRQAAATDEQTVRDTVLKALFNHENRLRDLEGKPPVTRQQFINALRNLGDPV